MAPVSTGLGEIYQYVVRPLKGYEGKYNEMELRTTGDLDCSSPVAGHTWCGSIQFGGKIQQYEIAAPGTTEDATLPITIRYFWCTENNQNTGGAYIEKGPNCIIYIRRKV